MRTKTATFSFFFALAFTIGLGPAMAPDSSTYLQHALSRSPLYPLYLDVWKSFGPAQLWFATFAQLFFGATVVCLLTSRLRDRFSFGWGLSLVIMGIFLSPYVGKTGNYILSDGLAYPLFLFFVAQVIDYIFSPGFKTFLGLLFTIALLVLTRGQFLYLLIVAGALSLLLPKKSIFKACVMILIALAACQLFERSYHYLFNNKFIMSESFGQHAAIPQLYLSNPSHAEQITDPRLKHIFHEIHQSIAAKGLTFANAQGKVDLPFHYFDSYERILYGNNFNVLIQYEQAEGVSRDELMTQLMKTLLPLNWQTYSVLVFKTTAHYLGGYYLCLFAGFIMVFSLSLGLKTRNPYPLLVFFLLLITFGNAGEAALVQAPHLRYSFYVDVILACLFILTMRAGLEQLMDTSKYATKT